MDISGISVCLDRRQNKGEQVRDARHSSSTRRQSTHEAQLGEEAMVLWLTDPLVHFACLTSLDSQNRVRHWDG